MKKLLSALLIVSLVFSSYKEAEAIAIPVAAVVVGATLLVAAGATQYYNNPAVAASAASAVSTVGNYYRSVDAYTQGLTAYGKAQLYRDAATLQVAGQAIIDAVKAAADGMYSALKNALADSTDPAYSPSGVPVGSIISAKNPDGSFSNLKTTSLFTPSSPWGGSSSGIMNTSEYSPGFQSYPGYIWFVQNVRDYDSTHIVYQVWSAFATSDSNPPNYQIPPLIPITPSSLPARLAPNGSVPADVAGEMDDLIRNNPSIATPTSGTTAVGTADADNQGKLIPPFIPVLPQGVTTTPPQIITGLGSDTVSDANARLAAAQQALTDAQAAAAADPTNPALQQAVATAQTSVSTITGQLADATDAASESYVAPTGGPRKSFDWSKWHQLLGLLASTFPFSLISTISGYLSPFSGSPVAPSFDLHIYGSQKLHIDLSPFDIIASICRWALGLLMTAGIVQFVIKWYRGTS